MAQFIRPTTGRITSFYGRRLHPIKKVMEGHHGIDIAAPGIVPIKATASGTVSRTQPNGSFGTYGNMVTIKHAGGWESLYAHLSRYTVKVGQSVKQGQIIGYMGNTGGSTGQHLHFELHKGGWNNAYSNEVNPLHYYYDEDVKRLQEKLIIVGQNIKADGWYGNATDTAVKAFQKSEGLVVDGSAGPATIAALDRMVAAASKPKPEIPKEETTVPNLYKPTSQDIVNSTATVLRRLEQKENEPLSPQWRKKLLAGTLTQSDAVGLLYVAIERGHIVGK